MCEDHRVDNPKEKLPQSFTANDVDKYRVKEVLYANGHRKYVPELQLASYVHLENESQNTGWINIGEENFKSGYFCVEDARQRIKKRKEEQLKYKSSSTVIGVNYLSGE